MANADTAASIKCAKGLLISLPRDVEGWTLKFRREDLDPCTLRTIKAVVASDKSPTLAIYGKGNVKRELILQTDRKGNNNTWGTFWFEILDYEVVLEGETEVGYEIGNPVEEHSFNLQDAIGALLGTFR